MASGIHGVRGETAACLVVTGPSTVIGPVTVLSMVVLTVRVPIRILSNAIRSIAQVSSIIVNYTYTCQGRSPVSSQNPTHKNVRSYCTCDRHRWLSIDDMLML